MALYVVVHHRNASEQPWSNAWTDDDRLRAITTTAEIGRMCSDARSRGEEVFVHRCAYGDPIICCAATVCRVAAISKSDAYVEFAAARIVGARPTIHPIEGQNSYEAPPSATRSS
jgi:hypothetical protein